MQFDFDQITPEVGYKLLTSTILPRPIAWVTTLGLNGVVNAAPYSFSEMKCIAQQAYDSALSVQADKYICHR